MSPEDVPAGLEGCNRPPPSYQGFADGTNALVREAIALRAAEPGKAAELFHKAAELGNMYAMSGLGGVLADASPADDHGLSIDQLIAALDAAAPAAPASDVPAHDPYRGRRLSVPRSGQVQGPETS